MTGFTLLDRETWDRCTDFDFFMDKGMCIHCCANVEVGKPVRLLKERGLRFFIPMVYLVGRCLNGIEGFRVSAEHYPTHEDARVPVRLDRRDASFPILNSAGNPMNVLVEFSDDFEAFYDRATAVADAAVERGVNTFSQGNACFIMSYVPLAFTDISGYSLEKPSLIPVVIVGKYTWDGDKCTMPVSLTVPHAFVDGMQIAEFYERLQGYCDDPLAAFGLM